MRARVPAVIASCGLVLAGFALGQAYDADEVEWRVAGTRAHCDDRGNTLDTLWPNGVASRGDSPGAEVTVYVREGDRAWLETTATRLNDDEVAASRTRWDLRVVDRGRLGVVDCVHRVRYHSGRP